MGEVDGNRGAWAYVQGGMGAVSASIARSALKLGAHIAVNAVRSPSGRGAWPRGRGGEGDLLLLNTHECLFALLSR